MNFSDDVQLKNGIKCRKLREDNSNLDKYGSASKMKERIKKEAERQPYTNDRAFNKGKNDCIVGNIFTDEARYFLLCIGSDIETKAQ